MHSISYICEQLTPNIFLGGGGFAAIVIRPHILGHNKDLPNWYNCTSYPRFARTSVGYTVSISMFLGCNLVIWTPVTT